MHAAQALALLVLADAVQVVPGRAVKERAAVVLQVEGGLRVPPGGIVFVWHGKELRVDDLPAKVVVNE